MLRDLNKPVISPEEASENLLHAQMKGASTGIMFGGEKSGLKNSDLVKADEIINIKSDSEFSSINLAMSVMIISYQWYVQKMNFINTALCLEMIKFYRCFKLIHKNYLLTALQHL